MSMKRMRLWAKAVWLTASVMVHGFHIAKPGMHTPEKVSAFVHSRRVRNPMQCHFYATLLSKSGNVELAIVVLEAGLKQSPKARVLLESLLAHYAARQEWAKVCEIVESYLHDSALMELVSKDIRYSYGYALFQLGKIDAAIAQLESSIDDDSPSVVRLLGVASLLVHANRTDEALKYYLRAAEINPHHAEARQWAALYLTSFGRLDEADTHIDAWLKLDPPSDEQVDWIAGIYAQHDRYERAAEIRAQACWERARRENGVDDASRQADRGPVELDSQLDAIRALRRKLERSRRWYVRLWRLPVELVQAAIAFPEMLRTVHLPLRRMYRATADIRRGNKTVDETLVEGLARTAGDYSVLAGCVGTGSERIKVLQAGLDAHPSNRWLLHDLAQALVDTGQADEALQLCQTMRQTRSREIPVSFGVVEGRALEQLGRYTEARTTYFQAIDETPNWMEAWDALIALSETAGLLADANEARAALSLIPWSNWMPSKRRPSRRKP